MKNTTLLSTRGPLYFRKPLEICLNPSGHNIQVSIPDLALSAEGADAQQALLNLADQLVTEIVGLIRTPSHLLTDQELLRKGTLIGFVDVLNSDLYLEHVDTRWFLGHLINGVFVPVQKEYAPVQTQNSAEGLCLARMSVYRDGYPKDEPILELVLWKNCNVLNKKPRPETDC